MGVGTVVLGGITSMVSTLYSLGLKRLKLVDQNLHPWRYETWKVGLDRLVMILTHRWEGKLRMGNSSLFDPRAHESGLPSISPRYIFASQAISENSEQQP